MKNINDITRLDDDELEQIASDVAVKVPDSLESDVRAALASVRGVRKPFALVVSAVCSAAAVVALCAMVFRNASLYSEPKDSFDDPYEAYACLQSAFTKMGDCVSGTFEISAPVVENGISMTADVFTGRN